MFRFRKKYFFLINMYMWLNWVTISLSPPIPSILNWSKRTWRKILRYCYKVVNEMIHLYELFGKFAHCKSVDYYQANGFEWDEQNMGRLQALIVLFSNHFVNFASSAFMLWLCAIVLQLKYSHIKIYPVFYLLCGCRAHTKSRPFQRHG